MRQFIRHPANIPIDVSDTGRFMRVSLRSQNVSLGGVALRSATPMEPGTIVMVSISYVQPPFETRAHVVWCSPREGSYELGVEFLSVEDAFRARMVEQVCHIEHYRQEIERTEGRTLTVEEAAHEWIGIYAAQFPDAGSGKAN